MINWFKKKRGFEDAQAAPGEEADDSRRHVARGERAIANGDMAAARRHLNCATLLDPHDANAFYLLGKVAQAQGDISGAIENFNEALDIQPDLIAVFRDLSQIYLDTEKFKDAERVLLDAISHHQNSALFHALAGNLYNHCRDPEKAIESYRRALSIQSERVDTHNNLGTVLHEQGQFEAAIWHLRRALEIEPDSLVIHSNLLLILSFDTKSSNPNWQYFPEAKKFGSKATGKARQYTSWSTDRKEQFARLGTPRLRVGFVSGDLRNHPVGYFMEGVLSNLNPENIELVAYSMNAIDDALTKRIRPCFVQWRSIVAMSDEAAARKIHDDGIQILIDLSGHCAHNRLSVFSWKPAPVQAIWLGYLATTGVSEIDYVLADPVAAPNSVQDQFSEVILRLPETFFCFTPPAESSKLTINPLPAIQNRFITFGDRKSVV